MSTCMSPERAECSRSTIASEATSLAASLARTIAFFVSDALRRIERAHRVRSDARRLHEMPDDMLADIGISRGDIDHAVRHGSLPGERGGRTTRDGIHAPY